MKKEEILIFISLFIVAVGVVVDLAMGWPTGLLLLLPCGFKAVHMLYQLKKGTKDTKCKK